MQSFQERQASLQQEVDSFKIQLPSYRGGGQPQPSSEDAARAHRQQLDAEDQARIDAALGKAPQGGRGGPAMPKDPNQLSQFLAHTRAQLAQGAGGGQINVNGQDYPQAVDQNAANGDALRALDAVSPLVRSGIVKPEAVGPLLLKQVGGTLQENQLKQRRGIDAQNLVQQYKDDRITDKTFSQASQKLIQDANGGSEVDVLTDLLKERQVQQSQKVADYAQKNGVPAEILKWDENAGEVTLNPRAAAIQAYTTEQQRKQSEIKFHATQNEVQNRNMQLSNLQAQMQQTMNNIKTVQAGGGDIGQLSANYVKYNNAFMSILAGGPVQFDSPNVAPQAAAPIAAPSKPSTLAANSSIPHFSTVDEARQAHLNPGDPFFLKGVKGHIDISGKAVKD